MAVIYEHDFSEVANGTNLTDVTPTIGSALVKHEDHTENLTVENGLIEADGGVRYVTASNIADGNVEIDATLKVFTAETAACFLLPQLDFSDANIAYNGLLPWTTNQAGLFADGVINTTGSTWPAEENCAARCETRNGITRLFINHCEAIRTYSASPLTNKRAGIGYQGQTASGKFARFKSLRIATDFDRKQVVCIGDSLTYGGGSVSNLTLRQKYPYVLAQLFEGSIDVMNAGVNGESISHMVTRSNATSNATGADGYRWGYRLSARPAAARQVAVFYAGTNDRALGSSPAEILAELEAHTETLQGEGWKVVIVGHLYSEKSSPAGSGGVQYNAEVDELNELLQESSVFDRYVDLLADARLQDPEDTDYFDADKLHLNAAGAGVLAELVYAVASPLINPPTITLRGVQFPLAQPAY